MTIPNYFLVSLVVEALRSSKQNIVQFLEVIIAGFWTFSCQSLSYELYLLPDKT